MVTDMKIYWYDVMWHHKGFCDKCKEPFLLTVFSTSAERMAASNEQSKQIICLPPHLLLNSDYLCSHYLIADDLSEGGQGKLFWCSFALTQPLFTDHWRERRGEGTR